MRKINKIVVHTSATRPGDDVTAYDIDRWHRSMGANNRFAAGNQE